MTSRCPRKPPALLNKDSSTVEFLILCFTEVCSRLAIMIHFVVFANDRFDGVGEFVDRYNHSGNTLEFIILWDATTRNLGRAAFAHHMDYPDHSLIIVPSIVDLFTWDEMRGGYIPYYSSSTAAVTAFAEALYNIVVTLYLPPAPCRLIFAHIVGLNTFTWPDVLEGQLNQDWIHSVVPRVNDKVTRVNVWNNVPDVTPGWRVHFTYQDHDGPVVVNNYRTFPGGYLFGGLGTFVCLLEQYMDGLYHN